MDSRKKLIVAVGIFAAVSLVVIIIAIALHKPSNNSDPNGYGQGRDIYIDPDSGKTIIGSEGQTVEAASQEPLIYGSTELLKIGLTSDQVSLIRVHLGDYMEANKVEGAPITQISFIVSSLRQSIGNGKPGSYNKVTSDIRVNKTVKQRFEVRYVGLKDALIFIRDTNNKVLYVSESDEQD